MHVLCTCYSDPNVLTAQHVGGKASFPLNRHKLFLLRCADPSQTVQAICADVNLRLSTFSIDLTL